MKKTYTKKQITEAIAYWKKQLKYLNESEDGNYGLMINGELVSSNLIPHDNIEFDVAGYTTPNVQLFVDANDVVECIVFHETKRNYSRSFIVDGLTGGAVRKNALHRRALEIVNI